MSGDPIARLRAADPLGGELPPALPRMPEPRAAHRRRPLVLANAALAVAVAAHAVDHGLQEGGYGRLTTEVFGGGLAMGLFAAVSLLLAVRAHRRAPLVSAAGGAWIAVAVSAAHFLPHWGAFSDSYPDLGLGVVSYLAAGAVVVAGVAMVATGSTALRRPIDA
jgi:hypothetical protein